MITLNLETKTIQEYDIITKALAEKKPISVFGIKGHIQNASFSPAFHTNITVVFPKVEELAIEACEL